MSLYTYFCFCCMSTDNLSSLNSENDTNYVNILKTFFNIAIILDDYQNDGHICENCANTLSTVEKFRRQILAVLTVLQSNKLIQILKEDTNCLIVKKANLECLSEDDEKSNKEYITKTAYVPTYIDDTLNKPEIIKPKIEEQDVKEDSDIQPTIDKNKCHYEKKNKLNSTEYEVTEDLTCTICSMVLPNTYTYHAHMNVHFPNHICETCGKGFAAESKLKRHMASHKEGPFKCTECDKVFTKYNTFSFHRQRKHSTQELYCCPHCEERFSTFSRRIAHLASVHQQTTAKYSCSICSRSFMTSGNLNVHMKSKHFVDKKYNCTRCKASYSRRNELAAHESTHTGEKAFKCKLCQKSYPRKKSLIVHIRTHTNDRRFGCELCGKRFIQKCTLLTHLKTHYGADLDLKHRNSAINVRDVEYNFV